MVKSVAKRNPLVGIWRPLLFFGSDELAAGDFLPGLTDLLRGHLILRARDPLE